MKQTLEGDHYAFIGDWIIRGIKGECYPCKPDIFEKTYGGDKYMKRFIIFTNEDLDKMKSGQMVVCKKCNFSESKDDQYDIYCVSEEWMNQYNSEENLP